MDVDRRSLVVGLAGVVIASAARAQGDDLGFEWIVHEELPDGRTWEGTWRRRGMSNVFDAEWSNGSVRDVIELRNQNGASVTLYRKGNNGTYFGRISRDGRHIRGTASWYPARAFWSARIRG